MDLISKFFVIPVLLIALSTTYLFAPLIGINATKHQYSSIDGLRGLLAMFVFLHHSSIWYYFSHIHEWSHIPSDLYNHFGSTSVGFFFMITAFLFFSKLINSFSNKLDWTKLYVSRIMRIMPIYILALFILVLIIAFLSHFSLKESPQNLVRQISQWILFMEPNINNIQGTKYINSGVQWSLTFEWVLYCSLASIGCLFFRIRTPLITIISTIIFLVIFLIIIQKYYPFREWEKASAFLPGIIGAILVRNEKVKRFCSNERNTLFLIVVPAIILLYYPTMFAPIPYLCVTIIFISIACGNTIFGILTMKSTLLLGQISYSIYLLHGFILFLTFIFIINPNKAEKLPIPIYWGIICICTIAVTVICSLTYHFVEKPGIDRALTVVIRVKQIFKKQHNHLVKKKLQKLH